MRTIGLLILLVLSAPASGLGLDPADRIYQETFVGESVYPTSPELDLTGAGGLSNSPPSLWTLDGTTSHASLFVTGPEGTSAGAVQAVALPSVEAQDVALRAHFENFSDGGSSASYVEVGLSAWFGGSPHVVLARYLDLGDGSSFNVASGGSPLGWSAVMPAPQAAAIRNGTPFVLDLSVDRATDTFEASIQVDGFAEIVTPALSAGVGTGDFDHADIRASASARLGLPAVLEIDVTRFEVFADVFIPVPLAPWMLAVTAVGLLGSGFASLASRRHRPESEPH